MESENASTKVIRLIRESRWVKAYETSDGIAVDSKYRTHQCVAGPAEFIDAWYSATEEERCDMEAAFSFFPVDPRGDVDLIVATIALTDPDRAERMRVAWTQNAGPITKQQVVFRMGLMRYLSESGVSDELIGENRWFRVVGNDAIIHIEPKIVSSNEAPTDAELESLEMSTAAPAYKNAIRQVRNCPFLLIPASGHRQSWACGASSPWWNSASASGGKCGG